MRPPPPVSKQQWEKCLEQTFAVGGQSAFVTLFTNDIHFSLSLTLEGSLNEHNNKMQFLRMTAQIINLTSQTCHDWWSKTIRNVLNTLVKWKHFIIPQRLLTTGCNYTILAISYSLCHSLPKTIELNWLFYFCTIFKVVLESPHKYINKFKYLGVIFDMLLKILRLR